MKNDDPIEATRRSFWPSWRESRQPQGQLQPFVEPRGFFWLRMDYLLAALFWGLPLLILFAGLARDLQVYAIGVALFWPVSLVLWVPRAIYNVARRKPEGDVPRAIAYLAHAVWPLGVSVFGLAALLLAFPLGWLLGAWASLKAVDETPRPLTQPQRLRLMLSGAMGWGLAAVALLTKGVLLFADVLRSPESDGFGISLGGCAVLTGACSAFAAWSLSEKVAEAWRLARRAPNAA